MRQFLLGGNVAYPTTVDAALAGSIGFTYLKDGVETVDTDGTGITKEGNITLFRDADKGGNVVLPFFKNNFSYVKGEYQEASTFEASVTIPAPTKVGDVSLIVAKKGVKFNERNKWTAMVHVSDVSKSASDIATELVKLVNAHSHNSGITAAATGAIITYTAVNPGEDYEILGADDIFGIDVTVSASGTPAYGDAKYVQDLADKAAADAGIEYTYRDSYTYLYPDYPLNPLKSNDAEDTGFTIFTLRFAEPRDVKTRDEVVNQIVQVAFPTGASAIVYFENVCKGLAGVATA